MRFRVWYTYPGYWVVLGKECNYRAGWLRCIVILERLGQCDRLELPQTYASGDERQLTDVPAWARVVVDHWVEEGWL